MEIQNSGSHPTALPRSSKCAVRFQGHEDAAQSLLSFSKDNESEYASSSLSDLPNMEKPSNHRSSLDFILNSTNENSDSHDRLFGSGNDFESRDSSVNELECSLDNQSLNHSSPDTRTTPSPIPFSRNQGSGNTHRLLHPSLPGFVTVNASQYNTSYPSQHFQNTHYPSLHNHGSHFSHGANGFALRASQHYMHHHLPSHGRSIPNHNSIEMKNIMSRYSFQQHQHISTLPIRHIMPSQHKNIALSNSSRQGSITCSQPSQNVKTADQSIHDSNNIDTKDIDSHEDSQKRKRLDPSQLRVLEGVFEYTYFPSTELRRRLAQQLGLTPRTIQIWFQNKRQNWRNRAKLEEQSCISPVSQHQRLQASEIPVSYSSLQPPSTDPLNSQQLVFSNIAPRDIELQRLRRESDVYILSKPEVMGALSRFRSSNTGNFVDQAFKLRRGY